MSITRADLVRLLLIEHRVLRNRLSSQDTSFNLGEVTKLAELLHNSAISLLEADLDEAKET